MYNCDMCNTSFETKEEFFKHPHIVQKRVEHLAAYGLSNDKAFEQSVARNKELLQKLAEPHISDVRFSENAYTPSIVDDEPVIVLSLHDAAEQALWDLRQWVKDHSKPCECFTCGDSIPDLERALNPPAEFHGICC